MDARESCANDGVAMPRWVFFACGSCSLFFVLCSLFLVVVVAVVVVAVVAVVVVLK